MQSTLYSSYPTTWMALFQITLGDYSVSIFLLILTEYKYYVDHYFFVKILKRLMGRTFGRSFYLLIIIFILRRAYHMPDLQFFSDHTAYNDNILGFF